MNEKKLYSLLSSLTIKESAGGVVSGEIERLLFSADSSLLCKEPLFIRLLEVPFRDVSPQSVTRLFSASSRAAIGSAPSMSTEPPQPSVTRSVMVFSWPSSSTSRMILSPAVSSLGCFLHPAHYNRHRPHSGVGGVPSISRLSHSACRETPSWRFQSRTGSRSLPRMQTPGITGGALRSQP